MRCTLFAILALRLAAGKVPGAKDGKDGRSSKDEAEQPMQRGAGIKPIVPLLEKLSN